MNDSSSTGRFWTGPNRSALLLLLVAVAIGAYFIFRPTAAPPKESPILIGVIDPLTGPFAAYGAPVRDGIQMAVDEINAAGGINGRKLELVIEDDGGDPKNAVNAFTKLATVTKVPVVIGPLSSGASMATAPLAERYGVVQISTLAGTMDLTKAGDFVFRIYPSSEVASRFIAKETLERFKAKRVAILYPNNAIGVSSRQLVLELLHVAGVEVVAAETFQDGDKDYRTQLTKISQAKPDILLCSAYYEDGAHILVQAKELGLTVPVLGEDGWFGPIAAIARDALPNLYFGNVAFGSDYKDNARMQRFIQDFEKRYGHKPNSAAATGYAAVEVVRSALTQGGSEAEKVKEALYKVDQETVFGRIRYDANGDNVGAVYDLYQLNAQDEPVLVR